MSKTRKFRELNNKTIAVGVGAHDGITAKLIENNGFDFVWASSLEISSAHAVPDCSILTMTQFLTHAKMMNDVVKIPILLDADTGYGDAINVIQLVKECERIGIAAICIEDKKFPKQNSLCAGCAQTLLPIREFCQKIRAVKETQVNPDFMLFARIESLIAGAGLDDALERANAYVNAGVDGIMIHSKSEDPQEILDFIEGYHHKIPLLLVPTTYKLTREQLRGMDKVKYMIFANHVIRSEIKAVNDTLNMLHLTGDIKEVEEDIAPLSQLFDLVGMDTLKTNKAKYS